MMTRKSTKICCKIQYSAKILKILSKIWFFVHKYVSLQRKRINKYEAYEIQD